MMEKISTYQSLCDALALLFHPLVEAVVHDRTADRIVAIAGALSSRRVGDPSLLSQEPLPADLAQTVYRKMTPDGRLIKSISVPLDDQFLLCINSDVSVFSSFQVLLGQLIAVGGQQPEVLFKNDWQERVHQVIAAFLKEKGWDLSQLSGKQKRALVQHLFEHGAFTEKNAADYIAQVLAMGRATIFNYLRVWRDVR